MEPLPCFFVLLDSAELKLALQDDVSSVSMSSNGSF